MSTMSPSIANPDIVLIDRLHVQAITGRDFWKRPTPQPLEVSVQLRTDFKASSETDDLKYSLNYAVISRNISKFFEKNRTKNFKSFENVAQSVAEVVLDEKKGGGQNAQVLVSGGKTEIRADQIQAVLNRQKIDGVVSKIESTNDIVLVKGLRCSTLIGVFTFERLQKQYVSLDIEIVEGNEVNTYGIIDDVANYVENSNFKTVEALIESVAQIVTQHGVLEVTARVEKPNAITFAEGVGVQVTRTAKDFEGKKAINCSPEHLAQTALDKASFNLPSLSDVVTSSPDHQHTAFIAFGTNVGDQIGNIITAIKALNSIDNTKVVSTSSLYESEPMYVLDQQKFLNGVLEITTTLSPQTLLKKLKEIEYDVLGREKIMDNGPRSIDLDIVLYDDLVLNDTEANLVIPHIRLIERTFVLQPLCELIPPTATHPVTAEPFHNHLKQLYASSGDLSKQKSNLLLTHVPLYNKFSKHHRNRSLTFDLLTHSHRTQLMGILNTTPDSFSDGGLSASLPLAIENALKMVHAGVDIIDIGGVSTRPGSIAPDAEEEWRRVVPIVEAIRKHEDEKLKNVIISVDTYRAEIAKAAVMAGADIINDISGGLFDEQMFNVIAETGVPYVLNHTRGTPDTMSKLNHYDAAEGGLMEFFNSEENMDESEEKILIKAVSRELAVQYRKAVNAGVKRWQIITDPGIGFAKDLRQNLAIIRGTPLVKTYSSYDEEKDEFNSLEGLPILLGPSRKKFIGTLTNEKIPAERVLTTGAVIMSCVGYQSDIVRVHDVEEVKKVLLIGDALYRDVL